MMEAMLSMMLVLILELQYASALSCPNVAPSISESVTDDPNCTPAIAAKNTDQEISQTRSADQVKSGVQISKISPKVSFFLFLSFLTYIFHDFGLMQSIKPR